MANNSLVSRNNINTNEKKGAATMNNLINEQSVEMLKEAGIPSNIIESLKTVAGLRNIIRRSQADKLLSVKGIGEKRSVVIMKVLQEAIKQAKLSQNVRWQAKAEKREKATGFSVMSFDSDELFRDFLADAETLRGYRPREDEDPELLPKMREVLFNLMVRLDEAKAFTVRREARRTIRLNKSAVSDVLGVDYESKRPTSKLIVIQHDVQRLFGFSTKLFAPAKDDGQKALDKFQQDIMTKIGYLGIKVLNEDGTFVLYNGVASSAGHQKQEKLLMAEAKTMKAHENFFWFGKSMKEFVAETQITGAELWKMRANLVRPLMRPFEFSDGSILNVHKILVVKDVKKVYEIANARRIGNFNGTRYIDGPAAEEVIINDGSMITIKKLAFQGQGSGAGFKCFIVDGTSSIEALCEKYGINISEFLDTKVEGIDGDLHRVGDFDAICGDGCWKFDKTFSSYKDYLDWIDAMEKKYPGTSNIYLLRQAEEIEEEDRVRRLTRTLIQQWMLMTPQEIRKLTKRARCSLKEDKTFHGAVKKLAGLWKDEEERSEVEKLFNAASWLVMNKNIQEYLGEGWKKRQIEAASGKFRTEGQYPYITQDPVAVLETWVLGKSPDDPNLGILKGDEISCADVPDGRKLLCVRFPANFLTAMVMTNRAFKKEFASLNGVAVLSVHSHILIAQDGDVDGDEMCILYNNLAIRLTEQMHELFHPPVVLFEHGGKPVRRNYENTEDFIRSAYTALWRAKRYDSVGLYANLATTCCYLATVAYKKGDKKATDNYLLQMSAASIGAILAIDQVKGNEVDEGLIQWLETISSKVRSDMRKLGREMGLPEEAAKRINHPFIHYYNMLAKRRPVPAETCLPENPDNFLDEVSGLILRDTGEWENFNNEGILFNNEAANIALTDRSVPIMAVKKGIVTKPMLDLINDNWFRPKAKTEEERRMDKTLPTKEKLKVGAEIGLKELVLLLWRNEASASYRMEGRTLWEKKEEYVGVCREIFKALITSTEWINKHSPEREIGYKFTLEEKKAILSNYLIRDALELLQGNGLDTNKGSYAMFCLKLFAKEAMANLAKNGFNWNDFSVTGLPADFRNEINEEQLEDDIELYATESGETPGSFATFDDLPYNDEAYLAEQTASFVEDDGWYSQDV